MIPMNDSVQLPNPNYQQKPKGEPKPMSQQITGFQIKDGQMSAQMLSPEYVQAQQSLILDPKYNPQAFRDSVRVARHAALHTKKETAWYVFTRACVAMVGIGVLTQLWNAVTGQFQPVAINQVDKGNLMQWGAYGANKLIQVSTPIANQTVQVIDVMAEDVDPFGSYVEVDQRQTTTDDIQKELAEGAINVNFNEP